jgi:alanine racemase
MEEAIALKERFPLAEVLVLGKTSPKEANALSRHRIIQSVHSFAYGKALAEAAEADVRMHTKLDVGMGRMGISTLSLPDMTAECLAISALPRAAVEGVFAHLPEADDPKSKETPLQIRKFHTALHVLQGQGLALCSHLSATAALLRFGTAGCSMARAGIGLYGISPSPHLAVPSLRPAMTLTCPLLQVKALPQNTKIGYGGVWSTPSAGCVGVIPFGYADGLPRLCEGGRVFVYGHPAPIVGRVSMDYATLWLGSIPAKEGDRVTVYDRKGKNLLALSQKASTIPYELLCSLSPRITRRYI